MAYIGIVPCRAGSERVPDKNTRPFAGYESGLIELKLEQLRHVPELDEIIVSSNDDIVLSFAEKFSRREPRVRALPRPDELGRSSTSMNDLILYFAGLYAEGDLLWTHVTSPFVLASHYRDAIAAYESGTAQGHDSLVSVTKLQKFLWNENGPINYDNSIEKWPRSQDLDPVFEINHAIYLMKFALMRQFGDRIGSKPFFFEIDEHDAADIDWENQFSFLEGVAKLKQARGENLIDG